MALKNNKSLGQHWLKNREILEEIADLSAYGVNDGIIRGNADVEGGGADSGAYRIAEKTEAAPLCVEIGPGLGFLTSSLLRRFDKVIAVEYDARLAANLPGSFPRKNLEVVNGDILKYDFGLAAVASGGRYVVAGNIPYYITSPIIEKVLTCEALPERVVLLVQKEVAERILSERETVLSLFVKNRAAVYAGPVVVAAEFTPPPKVDSQVVVMEPFAEGPVVSDEVFSLIRRGFAAPRKKLVHNLAGLGSRERLLAVFGGLGISADARPGDVHLAEWGKLYEKLCA